MNKFLNRFKRQKKEFLCALCSSNRSMKYSKNLDAIHYTQISLLSFSFTYFLWSSLGVNSLLFIPVIWALFEITNKTLYRKDVPCPNCGFDATWYRRDVKIAKNKVKEFWQIKEEAKFTKLDNSKSTDLESLM